MRFISTRTHGVLDYLSGLLILASPWIFGFATGGAEQWVPVIVGATVLLMSLMTNYEAGMVKTIPMPTHLTMDVLGGVLLAASPWIFDFDEQVYLPHVIFGLLEIGAGLFTERVPYHRGEHHQGEVRGAH